MFKNRNHLSKKICPKIKSAEKVIKVEQNQLKTYWVRNISSDKFKILAFNHASFIHQDSAGTVQTYLFEKIKGKSLF